MRASVSLEVVVSSDWVSGGVGVFSESCIQTKNKLVHSHMYNTHDFKHIYTYTHDFKHIYTYTHMTSNNYYS